MWKIQCRPDHSGRHLTFPTPVTWGMKTDGTSKLVTVTHGPTGYHPATDTNNRTGGRGPVSRKTGEPRNLRVFAVSLFPGPKATTHGTRSFCTDQICGRSNVFLTIG